MEEKEHKELTPGNNDDSQERTEHASRAQNRQHVRVPPSLLPVVLQRLGLSEEVAEPELEVDTLIEQLHSENWEERLNAVRMLGQLGSVPVEMLTSVVDDDDASVRAAALFALGKAGGRAPLHLLMKALNDRDWHVREVAVLALGKQGERVPRKVLQMALNDSDSSVREAAMIALRWHRTTGELENPAVSEGQRWEQQIMQEKERHQNGLSTRSLADEDWSGLFSTPLYESETGRPQRVLHEQQQAYASQNHSPDRQWQSYTPQEPESGGQMQMFAPDEAFSNEEQVQEEWQREPESSYKEYHQASSAQGEKVTSLPRQRQRRAPFRWILLIVMIAAIFFVLGGVVFQRSEPSISISTKAINQGLDKGSFSEPSKQFPFDPALDKMLLDSKTSLLARQEIANGLKLSPDDISQQLRSGQSMEDIASAQGVSPDQLHTIELNAFTNLVKRQMETGNISDKEGNGLIKQLQNDPGMLDKLTMTLFTITPAAPAAPSKPKI